MSDRPSKRLDRPDRLGRIVTRMGDDGRTRLVGGERVRKHHPLLEVLGVIEELQVAVAEVHALLDDEIGSACAAGESLRSIGEHLVYIQNLLFTLNGELATPTQHRPERMKIIEASDLDYLERMAHVMNAELPPLNDFLLVSGPPCVTAMHRSRVICRKLERRIEVLADAAGVDGAVRAFVNRLSDLFFIMGRFLWARLQQPGRTSEERTWQPEMQRPQWPK